MGEHVEFGGILLLVRGGLSCLLSSPPCMQVEDSPLSQPPTSLPFVRSRQFFWLFKKSPEMSPALAAIMLAQIFFLLLLLLTFLSILFVPKSPEG